MSILATTRGRKAGAVPARRGESRPAQAGLDQLHLVSSSAVLEEGGPPMAGAYTLFAVLLLIVGAIAWAATTDVTSATIAPGSVIPDGRVVELQHLEGGIVAEVPVRDGQQVEAGDVIMVLDPTADDADLHQIQARQAALNITAERLRAEAFGREPDFGDYIHSYPDLVMNQIDVLEANRAAMESERAVLESRLRQREAEAEGFAAEAHSLGQQRGVVGEQLAMRQTLLERGLASRLTVLDVQREYARLDGEMQQAQGGATRAVEAAEEARRSMAELELRYRSEAIEAMGSIAGELAEVNEMLTRLEDRVARREVRSPVRGTVNALAATGPGQVIEPGAPVASLVPADGALIVEAQMSPSDVGYVAVGQPVDITVDGFDVAQFGTLAGAVTFISPTTFTDAEGHTYYRIRVALDEPSIERNGERHALVPGMIVQASIHTGSQTMLSYLVRPVYRSLATSFTER
ncbi:MAG: HlyD family type I secretion periplasmic adaptor subunit [Alphaproteobacteria bacterium]